MLNELCVAAMQVDEVGGGDLPEMADFRGAFAAEMEGWAAGAGLRSTAGRGAAGMDPAPRPGALVA